MKRLVNILSTFEERLTFDACCSMKPSDFRLLGFYRHRLREIAMSNFAFGVPVKTRLPLKVWALAAIVSLFSLVSSMTHSHTTPEHALYAGVAAEHRFSHGS
jgi:hypothetical protein